MLSLYHFSKPLSSVLGRTELCDEVRNPGPKKPQILGKRKHAPTCSSEELFLAEKNGGHTGKISVVALVFLVFVGFLFLPPAWKAFSLRPEKFSKRCSIGGASVRFFLPWKSSAAKATISSTARIVLSDLFQDQFSAPNPQVC